MPQKVDIHMTVNTEKNCKNFLNSSNIYIVNFQTLYPANHLGVIRKIKERPILERAKELMIQHSMKHFQITSDDIIKYDVMYVSASTKQLLIHLDVHYNAGDDGEIVSNCVFEFVKTKLH